MSVEWRGIFPSTPVPRPLSLGIYLAQTAKHVLSTVEGAPKEKRTKAPLPYWTKVQ